MTFHTRFPVLVAATALLFGAIAAAADSTANLITSTVVATPTGSFTICQYYSSVPGATGGASEGGTTFTLPPCPSSIITFSYTGLLTTVSLTTASGPIPTTITPTPAPLPSYSLCGFFSYVEGATAGPSTTELLPCPSDISTFTYSLPPTTPETVTSNLPGSSSRPVGTAGTSATVSGSGLAESFPGAAAPTAAVGKAVVVGIGALVAAAGLV